MICRMLIRSIAIAQYYGGAVISNSNQDHNGFDDDIDQKGEIDHGMILMMIIVKE